MKITEIAIFDHKQFKNFIVDLTYPEGHPKAGLPLEKVCFIGPNGTGKTTILEMMRDGLFYNGYFWAKQNKGDGLISVKIDYPEYKLFRRWYHSGWDEGLFSNITHLKKYDVQPKPEKQYYLDVKNIFDDKRIKNVREFIDNTKRKSVSIYSPSESIVNNTLKVQDNPITLNEALSLFGRDIEFNHEVSNEKINDFWRILTFQVKKREDEYQKFLKKDNNRNKTIGEVETEFDKTNPKILDKLAELWNQILAKAGLEFDAEGASNPVQLTDNLKAYIRLKSNKQPIPYNELSTGIRNFIFKVGHIYSLYFNRNIESGFLMIDEPENSLFPDFLYDLVNIYQEITQNTQIFMATHSPIIAAQFEPCERIILDFDEEGYVTAKKGIVPVGDDPNDILVKDFGIRSLLGKEGVAKWERFIELKLLIKSESNQQQKAKLIDEYMQIGKAYNFGYDLKLKQDEKSYQEA
jgi:predicted ATPase